MATASATSSTVKLPEALVSDASALRARMLKLAGYHFDEHPVYGAEISSIRAGTGYADLSQDLERLANLFDAEQETVSTDSYYRPEAPADARRLANQIYEQIQLQIQESDEVIASLYPKAWSLASETYNEVRAAAMFLFRKISRSDLL